ncbi:MAG: hypothetical protein J7J96_03235 [Sulfurimonas sp.]|nr:hypothetical protein [Sulfurimonas sp.]
MDDTMKISLVNNALDIAIKRRKPDPSLIWHMLDRRDKYSWGADRESQYASYEHKDL